ncbi:hypothetical protein B0H15DRAFT_279681 [Mycena belliarum]|uniref:Uncharacterized protein n=1 Tax=Mycena belliarum TaxID=1033014 RepID=A0AAD6U6Q3_9AGAR|nr:hypothetical protein B0H15DRAFT_279681 [Mycena belliae]
MHAQSPRGPPTQPCAGAPSAVSRAGRRLAFCSSHPRAAAAFESRTRPRRRARTNRHGERLAHHTHPHHRRTHGRCVSLRPRRRNGQRSPPPLSCPTPARLHVCLAHEARSKPTSCASPASHRSPSDSARGAASLPLVPSPSPGAATSRSDDYNPRTDSRPLSRLPLLLLALRARAPHACRPRLPAPCLRNVRRCRLSPLGSPPHSPPGRRSPRSPPSIHARVTCRGALRSARTRRDFAPNRVSAVSQAGRLPGSPLAPPAISTPCARILDARHGRTRPAVRRANAHDWRQSARGTDSAGFPAKLRERRVASTGAYLAMGPRSRRPRYPRRAHASWMRGTTRPAGTGSTAHDWRQSARPSALGATTSADAVASRPQRGRGDVQTPAMAARRLAAALLPSRRLLALRVRVPGARARARPGSGLVRYYVLDPLLI